MHQPTRLTAMILLVLMLTGGCSRLRYVQNADSDAFSILGHRSQVDPLSAPTDLSISPSLLSRLLDPTPVDAPGLPDPRPRLHSYAIPEEIGTLPSLSVPSPETIPPSDAVTPTSHHDSSRRTATLINAHHEVRRADFFAGESEFLLARLVRQEELPPPAEGLAVIPLKIPQTAWENIPVDCRRRIFDFAAIREQYQQSFGNPPPIGEQDTSRRLQFEDILHLALLNSREYQTQKEQLYRVALRLTLEQYDYQLKFAPFGNRTGLGYEYRTSNDISQSQLAIPSQIQAEALLTTGTSFVTRFANQVLLTFNGPNGFAADISSEMLFGLTHSVFQNDVRFERLTQAERNVVYEAREFAHFRRTFYEQLAVQYFNLLRNYRQIEIDAQNYLSLVRVYGQREVEFSAGEVARLQIDQVEQNTLFARSNLIANCNVVENAVDLLKLRMGLPTETAIQLDLAELRSLTQGDERLVQLELIRRVDARITTELARQQVDDATLLNLTGELVARMQRAFVIEKQSEPTAELGDANSQVQRLQRLQSWLKTTEQRALSNRDLSRLRSAQSDAKAPAIRVPELTVIFARSVLALLKEEAAFAAAVAARAETIDRIESSRADLFQKLKSYEEFLNSLLGNVQLQHLLELTQRAHDLAADATQVAEASLATNRLLVQENALGVDDNAASTASRLLQESRELIAGSRDSLPAIELDFDSTSLAGLTWRLDLANARGAMFDEWRRSKLAADDLKSILDLQARQRLITQNQVSTPFELDLDESRTELQVTIDTPLNRRRQRNTFREQLLNYQVSRRDVMALEDRIKLDIRSDLRSIRQSREQHRLGIASAALAYERVISTELQLRLGVAGVAARDYLEAQTAYANSLSTVAARHTGYIVGRINLFTNLEQLQLDPYNNWGGLRDSSWQPEITIDELFHGDYGDLPADLHYSRELRDRSKQFWGPPEYESPTAR